MTRHRAEAEEPARGEEKRLASSALDNFATNLNEMARQGRIDPLIGRASEVERTAQILCRRRKNNPLLVGEAGVGKTAIAEGWPRRSSTARCRTCWRRGHLRARPGLAGGRYQVSRRLREAAEGGARRTQAQAARDPVHRRDPHHHRCRRRIRRRHGRVQPDQAGAGLGRSALHRLDHLPGVPRHLREGSGAGRRFQKIDVNEPSVEETIEILKGLKKRFEEHHQVATPTRPCAPRRSCRPSTSTIGTCRTRPSTSSTRPGANVQLKPSPSARSAST
jgi:ATP-dependent Clp protease ATP-binding subunit ClpA